MFNNFTPLTTDLQSDSQSKAGSIKKIINRFQIIVSFIFGVILFIIGIFLTAASVYGMKDVFGIVHQLLYHTLYLSRDSQINIFKYFFTGISGIIAGNIFSFSGVKFILHKKSGFKLLLLGLSVFLLNFILSVALYILFKFQKI